MMEKELEVESGELAVMSSKGMMAIVPRNKARWVKQKISEGCHSCVDEYIKTLPNVGK